MYKLVIASALILSTNPCHAALSAFSQGVREMKEILDSPYRRSHLPQGNAIYDLKLIQEDGESRLYQIQTTDKIVYAKLTYIKSAKLGPRQYEIEWSDTSGG